MASLNFPSNPAAQTPTNTFGPTSTPNATLNGVTYVYDGNKWIASSEGSQSASDLQAVTDAGNVTTNGATFGGNVTVTIRWRILVNGDTYTKLVWLMAAVYDSPN